jgi:hypothetical protein
LNLKTNKLITNLTNLLIKPLILTKLKQDPEELEKVEEVEFKLIKIMLSSFECLLFYYYLFLFLLLLFSS